MQILFIARLSLFTIDITRFEFVLKKIIKSDKLKFRLSINYENYARTVVQQ